MRKSTTASPYEARIGFSRALRKGNIITVSGTAPLDNKGSTAYPGNVYLQTNRCLDIIQESIESLGGSLEGLIRTRILLTKIEDWEEASRAHQERLGRIAPATTVVQVVRFIEEDWLVEIEAECVCDA